jgi:uncharacterized protein
MGPTNVALVKLFRADQALREAQERLDAATKNVRVQERRANDHAEKLKTAQTALKELQSKSGGLDLDMKSRDAQIEKLRSQQQNAKNNKEYQTFLIEINTQKVDRAKIEEEAMVVLEKLEVDQKAVTELSALVDAERAKLAEMKAQMGDTVAKLQAEIDSLKAPREAAEKSLSPKAREVFNRLAEHHDGEAMSPVMKPDRRKEEYVCSACMIDLVTDVYNKLHTRDEIVFCPSCRRILYIPDDLPPEMAVHKKKSSPAPSSPSGESPAPAVKTPPRARGRLGDLLTAAQGESVKNAVDANQNALEFQVEIDGHLAGVYKGKSAENLERVIRFIMDEVGIKHDVKVAPVHAEPSAPEPAAPEASQPTSATPQRQDAPAEESPANA